MSNQLQVSGAAKIRSIQGPVVANSGVISALDGDASQYVRGDGTLADFPTSTGGGSSVSYYLNSSVSQGTIGGVAYRQLGKTPIAGAGTDITTSANGYIASYITDANDPALLEVPAGNFNCEFYFSVNNNTGDPFVYAEVYKYDGTTFTLLGTSVGVPEYITEGTVINPYYFAVPVATSVLTVTDRISIRIYVNVDGRTVTLHTENNHLCQVVTTFSKGLISLNNLTRQNQFFQTGTSGTDFAISSATATHTFNLPVASASNTGKLSSTDWSTFNGKVPYTGATASVDLGVYNFKANIVSIASAGGSNQLTSFANTNSLHSASAGLNVFGFNTSNNIYFGKGLTGGGLGNGGVLIWSNTQVRYYTLPDADGTLALTSNLSSYLPLAGGIMTGSILLNNNLTISGQLFGTSSYASMLAMSPSDKVLIDNSGRGVIFGGTIGQGAYTYTFPAATGTIALTSNLSSYVPYTGATAILNLGIYGLTTSGVDINTTGGGNAGINFYLTSVQKAAISASSTFLTFASQNTGGFTFQNPSNAIIFSISNTGVLGNGTYSYTLPSATGTLALTSDLGSYVPLAGNVNVTGPLGINTTGGAGTTGLTNFGTFITRSDSTQGFPRKLAISMASGTLVSIDASGNGANYITDMAFSTSTASGINATPAIYITGTNNRVGIKTGTPAYDLDVSGTGRFTGQLYANVKLEVNDTNGIPIRFQDISAAITGQTAGYIGMSDSSFSGRNGDLVLYPRTSAASNILLMGGNVGIGASSPSQKLEVYAGNYDGVKINATDVPSLFFYLQSGTQKNWGIASTNLAAGDFGIYQSNSGAGNPITAGTARLYINSSGVITISSLGTGAVTATSGVLSTTSDMNLKIEDGFINNALEKVLKLTPRYFLWKEESGLPTDLRQLGFYAQEVNEALGEEVANTPKDENQSWGIYDRGIIAMLTKAMQEQNKIIEDLKARLDNAGL